MQTYMQSFPDGYAPQPGSMQVPRTDYKPYDGSVTQNAGHSNQRMVPDEFWMSAPELRNTRASSQGVGYEDDVMEPQEGFNGPKVMLRGNTEVTRQFMRARAGEETPELDNDLRAQMLEIQMAVGLDVL